MFLLILSSTFYSILKLPFTHYLVSLWMPRFTQFLVGSQLDLFCGVTVREIIFRNILSAVFSWYDTVYEFSGAERDSDVLYVRGHSLAIDSVSVVFS